MYKEQLDSQMRIKAAYRAAGNMTGVEKQMNKDDMVAWKKYDNKQYALIPGMQTNKQFAEPRPKKSPLGTSTKAGDLTGSPSKLTNVEKEEILRKNEERLAAYGFTHL